MTANQLERFARAHRQVTQADDAGARVRRRLTWRLEEDGSLSGTFRLPPLQGAVLLKALRAACADLRRPIRAGTFPRKRPLPRKRPPRTRRAADEPPPASAPAVRTSSDLADGLVAVAESFLAGKVAGADDAEVYQVVVHAGTGVLAGPRRRLRPPARRRFRGNAGRPRPGSRVTRRTRPGATSRTARRSACPPRRCSPAPRRCPG